jgi:hypothetical protein
MLTHCVTFHSKKEFNYAELKRGGQKMVAVVMQARCRNAREWLGAVGMILGSSLYVDFSSPSTWSDPAEFDAKVDELSTTIFAKVSRSPVDLAALLESLSLPAYLSKLADEGCKTVDHVRDLTEDDLKNEIGMKLAERRRLHAALNQASTSSSNSSPSRAQPVPPQPASPPQEQNKQAPLDPEWVRKAEDPENLFKAAKDGNG